MKHNLPIKMDLPDHFFEEEERCGYTVSTHMKKVWAIELDLLVEMLRVCKDNNINIYASDGTLLGAVRHGGMIPWDDDIDLCMLRPDYEKLCKIAESVFKEPYFFQTNASDPGTIRGHAQFRNSNTTAILDFEKKEKFSFNQGIFIDIFPLDIVPEDEVEREKLILELKNLMNKARRWERWTGRFNPDVKGVKYKIAKRFTSRVSNLLSLPNPYYKKCELLKIKYANSSSRYLADLAIVTLMNGYYHFNTYFDHIEYKRFENIEIPVPAEYKSILDRRYGDWHKYEYSGSVHGGVFFDLVHLFKEYITGERLIPDNLCIE